MMKILADSNIPFAVEAFSDLGEVRIVPTPEITPESVRDLDILLTRSTVKLGPALLENSRVRFVATATSGVDHVDQTWLAKRGVGFASAHGSNANAVAEWFVLSLLTLTKDRPEGPSGLCVGVVGVGAVGTLVEGKARALGCKVLRCDPPLERAGGEGYVSLAEVLEGADALTLHVPKISEGVDKTIHMIGAEQLAALKPGSLVLNASRGDVIDGDALVNAIGRGHVKAALDVWEQEPNILGEHVTPVFMASPHTAGHSLDAKAQGTAMIRAAAGEAMGSGAAWDPAPLLPESMPLKVLKHTGSRWATVLRAVRHFHQWEPDDAFVREVVGLPAPARGKSFRQYRRDYPIRREFHTSPIAIDGGDEALREMLVGLGFAL